MAMTGFFCQDEYLVRIARLTDEEVGRLFRALMIYHKSGEELLTDGRECVAFDFIREDIDRDEASYAKKCEQAKENRRRGTQTDETDDDGGQRPSTPVNGGQRPSADDDGSPQNININKKEKIKPKKISLDASFDRFWTAYPRHDTKAESRKAFEKISPDDDLLAVMLNAIEQQKRSSQWTDPRYIPQPRTWLNQRRWEDEPQQASDPPKPQKQVPAQQYEQRDYGGGDDSLMDVMAILQGDMKRA